MNTSVLTAVPIAFKIRSSIPARKPTARRVAVRALAGMQKEALVSGSPDAAWRLLCDEGPYLNGTDLAPYPLGFFAAGQMFSAASAILNAARHRGTALRSLTLRQKDRYTMQGSFLRGDAVGGALAPDLVVAIEAEAKPGDIVTAVRRALAADPGFALLRVPAAGSFTLTHNGQPVSLGGDAGDSNATDPSVEFDAVVPAEQHEYLPDIIIKLAAAEVVSGVPGGSGSSLQAVQDRTLLIQGEARRLDERHLQADVGLKQPIGSRFRFHADMNAVQDGTCLAPDPLDYLAAGIAFCFMTQLGRYAHIKKLRLHSYRIVQFSGLDPRPWISTHVFLESDEDDAAAADLVRTGERTCFLHAALRAALEPIVGVELNGAPLPL